MINSVSGKCSVILNYLKRWTFVEIIASFCEPRSLDNFFSPSNILLFNLINLILFFTLLWTSRYLPPGEGREEEWWRLVFCHLLWERNSLARSSLVRLILHNSWKKKLYTLISHDNLFFFLQSLWLFSAWCRMITLGHCQFLYWVRCSRYSNHRSKQQISIKVRLHHLLFSC